MVHEKIYSQIQTETGKQPILLNLGITIFADLCKEMQNVKHSGLVINRDGNLSLWGIKIKIDYEKRNLIEIIYEEKK